ncbi:hypothetical protein HanRHA438_Chr01g0036291 [Helianthus annuus]|nr:hypothetical protein HanRHA438_Chr01g0036291 [Helianthus annuus]
MSIHPSFFTVSFFSLHFSLQMFRTLTFFLSFTTPNSPISLLCPITTTRGPATGAGHIPAAVVASFSSDNHTPRPPSSHVFGTHTPHPHPGFFRQRDEEREIEDRDGRPERETHGRGNGGPSTAPPLTAAVVGSTAS